MPDITMCTCESCALSKTCYRHSDSGTMPTIGQQSYADFKPVIIDNKPTCDFYINDLYGIWKNDKR